MEVATPSISGITTTELDQLRQKVAVLKTMLKSLQIPVVSKKSQHVRSPSPARRDNKHNMRVGTMPNLVTKHRSASPHAVRRDRLQLSW